MDPARRARRRRWLGFLALGVIAVLGVALFVFWDDVMRNGLDPKVPFQTYEPPPAPSYLERAGWSVLPDDPLKVSAADPPVDVFFLSPTTYDGGAEWNGPVGDAESDRVFRRVMAPNYAGPFVRLGRLFAPRYRQASLYSQLTLREDAREARRFAYGDVAEAFRTYLQVYSQGRPFILVGAEQGGSLAARLLAEEVAPRPDLRARLVAAYLIDTVVPADGTPIPACTGRDQSGCMAAWASVFDGDLELSQTLLARALVWGPHGELESLGRRPALCFNPILGAVTNQPAPARLHLGAANATGLEWDARPAFLARQVSAQCQGGMLKVSRPKSASLRRTGDWADRRKAPGYNLFYADLEADAKARITAERVAVSLRP